MHYTIRTNKSILLFSSNLVVKLLFSSNNTTTTTTQKSESHVNQDVGRKHMHAHPYGLCVACISYCIMANENNCACSDQLDI